MEGEFTPGEHHFEWLARVMLTIRPILLFPLTCKGRGKGSDDGRWSPSNGIFSS
jgi:hypothetical protein